MIYDREIYHYLFLHFPIALFVLGYFFNFAAVVFKDELFNKFSFWNLGLGIITGIATIMTGFITDDIVMGHMDNPLPVWSTHGTHMIIAVALFYILFIIKFYWGTILKDKYILFIHTIILFFFIHGTHIGAKLADRV